MEAIVQMSRFIDVQTGVATMNAPQPQAAPDFEMGAGLSEEANARYRHNHRPREFDSPAQERVYRKQHLAAAFRLFSKFCFDEGAAGI
jgi:hypothetical protein